MFEKSQEDDKQAEQISQDRRHLLRRGGLFAGFTAVASVFSLTPFSPAHAAARSQSNSPKFTPLSEQKAEPYIKAVVQSSTYQGFKRQIQASYAGVFAIQEQKALTFQVEIAKTTSTQVIIPLTGGAGVGYQSFYTATFRSDNYTISSEYSGLMTQKNAQTVHVDIKEYQGTLVVDADLSTTDGSLHGTVQTSQKSVLLRNTLQSGQKISNMVPADFGSWSNCMKDCNVTVWALDILLTICGGVCAYWVTMPLCWTCTDLVAPLMAVATFEKLLYCLGYCS